MTAEVLTRSKGLTENISPTGVKYQIVPCPSGRALYQIKSNQPGSVVMELAGLFTSIPRAQSALTRYLNEFWNLSDSKKK